MLTEAPQMSCKNQIVQVNAAWYSFSANPLSLCQDFTPPVRALCREHRHAATPAQEEKTPLAFPPCLQPSPRFKAFKGVERQCWCSPPWRTDLGAERHSLPVQHGAIAEQQGPGAPRGAAKGLPGAGLLQLP